VLGEFQANSNSQKLRVPKQKIAQTADIQGFLRQNAAP
jgi:hypothetical protein